MSLARSVGRRGARLRLLVEATIELARASAGLRFGRAERVVATLGDLTACDEPVDVVARREAVRVGRMVTRAARRVPWDATCLRQAIAVRRMLHRRGIPCRVRLGIVDPRALQAHAWVTVGGMTVVGAAGASAATDFARLG